MENPRLIGDAAEMADSLKLLLMRRGLRADDVAQAGGFSRASMFEYLRGKARPRPERIRDLAKAIGVDFDTVAAAVTETQRRKDQKLLQDAIEDTPDPRAS